MTLAFIQNLRPVEIIFLLIVVLLLFGAKRLPELFRSFGKSIKEFKKATSEIEEDVRTAMNAEETASIPEEPKKINTESSPNAETSASTKADDTEI